MHRQNYQRFRHHTKYRIKNIETRRPQSTTSPINNLLGQSSNDQLLNKLSLVGDMSSCIAHGIRNPLTAVRGFAQLLAIDHPEKSSYYELMIEEIDQADELLKEFLCLAQNSPMSLKRVLLGDILRRAAGLLFSQVKQKDLNLYVSLNNDVFLYADEDQLVQVFVHLLKNALEASPEGGCIFVLSGYSSQRVRVKIIDRGSGIEEPILDRIMEPFFTTKEANIGLGMAIAYKIIRDHGGELKINSSPDTGTIVEVILPLPVVESEEKLA